MKKLISISIAILIAATSFAQQTKEKLTPEQSHQKSYNETVLVKNGQAAPDFTAEKYSGGNIKLSDYKGKIVYICYWGSWCGPCLNELKPEHLPAIINKYLGNKDFVFLPVAQDKREALDKFFSNEKFKDYKWLSEYTCIDGDRELFHVYAKQGVPRSVIVGKDGKVVETSIGSGEYELELIATTLKKLLGDK